MTFNRCFYLLGVYSGFRALWNQIRSRMMVDDHGLEFLSGTQLTLRDGTVVNIRIDRRRPPDTLPIRTQSGMMSVYLKQPGISRFIYSLLRLTSHFGYGHIELAFYKNGNSVTVYAIRNIIKANLHRARLKSVLCGLKLSRERDEVVVLKAITEKLHGCGFHASLAPAHDCVQHAVTKSLIPARRRSLAMNALLEKYQRIEKKLKVGGVPASPATNAIVLSVNATPQNQCVVSPKRTMSARSIS